MKYQMHGFKERAALVISRDTECEKMVEESASCSWYGSSGTSPVLRSFFTLQHSYINADITTDLRQVPVAMGDVNRVMHVWVNVLCLAGSSKFIVGLVMKTEMLPLFLFFKVFTTDDLLL